MTMNEDELKEKEEKINEDKKRIQEVEREIKKSQIELRVDTLKKLYDRLMQKYDQQTRSSVYLNEVLLYAAVSSYYDDIYRFKDFSCSKWADNHKQAGYTIKWIAKFRPIQVLPGVEINKTIFIINSVFALFTGFSFLDTKVAGSISSHFYNHLIYLTLYRNLSGKHLASEFYVLECAVQNKMP